MPYQIKETSNNISWIDIDNTKNLKLRLCSYGASVYSIKFLDQAMTLEVSDENEFLNSTQFFGKTLGQIAGRIKTNFVFNDKEIHLRNSFNENCFLHGGLENSLSFKNFKIDVTENNENIIVKFKYNTELNENGIPGKANIKIIYYISKLKDEFKIVLNAKALEDTLINLSNHIYWNFNTFDISDYLLKFNSKKYGGIDNNKLIVNVSSLPFYLDFNRATKLCKQLDYIEAKTKLKTIDFTYLFNDEHTLTLRNNEFELLLETSYKALNIYVDNSLSKVKFNNFLDSNHLRRAIAFEPQDFVFDFNSLILRKNEERNNLIKYTFKRRKTYDTGRNK